MSFWFTVAVAVCIALATFLLLIDIVQGRRMRGIVGLVLLFSFVICLKLTVGFPMPGSRTLAFGGTFPTSIAVVLMFGGVVFGMLGHYIWRRPTKFSILELARPLVASPIVLLPLIGSLDGAALQPIQLISLTLLAFQNGFFWPRVLQDVQPQTS